MTPQTKRLLLVMYQPPGCNGVQAFMFSKLLPYLENNGWEFHFVGPAPELFSVVTEAIDYPSERLHYTTAVSRSRIYSVRKNRYKKGSRAYLFNGGLQLIAKLVERLVGHDGDRYMQAGIAKEVRRCDSQWTYDIIAGISPDFQILELVSQLTTELHKPFFVIYTDPYGARMENGFFPKDPERQTAILNQACGVFFTSPLTRNRYVEAGLVSDEKAFYFIECYPESADLYMPGRSVLAAAQSSTAARRPLQLIYLGMLPEWRPAEPLLDAIKHFCQADGQSPSIQLTIFGYIYPAARERILADPELARIIHLHPILSYATSHWVAEDSDIQLVLIGPRHIDNLPSKFFDYLAHKKPVLVLGPPQNPLRTIMTELGIGCYVDGMDSQQIEQGLQHLRDHYSSYQQAFATNHQKIAAYSASQSARWFAEVLDRSLAWQRRPRESR
jgi:hypothetical protein